MAISERDEIHSSCIFHAGKTLLPQYLGMYRLTVDNVEQYMVVMRNIFSNHLRIHKKYDLKGSTVDREASQKEREKDHPTFKVIELGYLVFISCVSVCAGLTSSTCARSDYVANLHVRAGISFGLSHMLS